MNNSDILLKLEDIHLDINKMKNKIETIENQLSILLINNETVHEECKKMGTHIEFIQKVYENVKYPLGYICRKIEFTSKILK